MMMGAPAVFEPVKPRFGVAQCGCARAAAHDAGPQARARDRRRRAGPRQGRAAAEAGCSTGVIDGLVEAGTLVEVAIPERRCPRPNPAHARIDSRTPRRAPPRHARCRRRAEASPSRCSTASPAPARPRSISRPWRAALERGRQALIMLPEIALTSQFMDRFTRRFGCRRSSGIRRCPRPSAAAPGAPPPTGRRASWSAPARRCSCPSRISASSSSTRSTTRASSRRTASTTRPATWPWCAAAWASSRSSSPPPRRRSRATSMPGRGRYAPRRLARPLLRRRDAGGGGHRPAPAPPERGKWLSPVLVEAVTETLANKQQALLFLNRRGYAPLTLCRACGHRIDCPQCTAWLVEHRYRKPAQVPPLRLLAADARRSAPSAASPTRSWPAVRASSASPRRWPSAFPDARVALLSSDLVPVADRDARDHQDDRGGRGRHHHRHADGGQGPSLPAARHRRHRRRRPGARPGRPARGRAHVPAHAPGTGRAGRALTPRPRPRADLHARASGHAGHHLGRPRGFLGARDPPAAGRRCCRPTAGSPRSSSRRATRSWPKLFARDVARHAPPPSASRCWARPRRRSPSSAAATAGACWSRRRASSTCRPTCAPG